MKYNVKLYLSGSRSDYRDVGTYDSLDEAAEHGWDFAHSKGYTRSQCENHDSVVEALQTRQFCLLGYGPDSIEIEEIAN